MLMPVAVCAARRFPGALLRELDAQQGALQIAVHLCFRKKGGCLLGTDVSVTLRCPQVPSPAAGAGGA